jgi:hypothetical protein
MDVRDYLPPLVPSSRPHDSRTTYSARHSVLGNSAGSKRNAVAMARRGGHCVDVVGLSMSPAGLIRAGGRRGFRRRACHGGREASHAMANVRRDDDPIALSGTRMTHHVCGVFALAARDLAPANRLVYVSLGHNGISSDGAALRLEQESYANIYTRSGQADAMAGPPLRSVGDDSACEYEVAHLPGGAWSPVAWYDDWVSGLDVCDVQRERCRMELQWLEYEGLSPRPCLTR